MSDQLADINEIYHMDWARLVAMALHFSINYFRLIHFLFRKYIHEC